MSIVYLGLGSNSQPVENLRLCASELRRRFDLQAISQVYRNHAVGFEGDEFLNAVACVKTPMSPGNICDALEEIHELAGRQRGDDPYVARTLDIDLLLYDQLVIDNERVRVPRRDVLEFSFVLRPLAEMAPDLIHPLTGKTLASHWEDFAVESHPLRPVNLIL
jgi:2-amino-4-hydroxy-6-hydroxymethyldihydropteridine diphosphokinase